MHCVKHITNFAAGSYLSEAQNPLPPSFMYTVYFTQGKGERVEPERRLDEQQFAKLDRKYQHD
jgi:hypothetical protein